jgi:hypothetical protein
MTLVVLSVCSSLLETELGINPDGALTPDQLEVSIDFYFYSFA